MEGSLEPFEPAERAGHQTPDTPRASARNRRFKANDRLGLPTAGTGRCPFPDPLLFTLAGFQPVALQPLSRPRPLSSTGTGAVCNELHGVGRYLAAAGPCDAVTTSERCQRP